MTGIAWVEARTARTFESSDVVTAQVVVVDIVGEHVPDGDHHGVLERVSIQVIVSGRWQRPSKARGIG
jgi:hypothetical protein